MNNPEKNTETVSNLSLEEIRERVGNESERVAELGNWPVWMKPNAAKSLASRIPMAGDTAPGFDAGIACTLGLIPEDKQELSASLHAAYTPEKIAQVRKEVQNMNADSETARWLAACKECAGDEHVDEEKFRKQLSDFDDIAVDPEARLEAANSCYAEKINGFEIDTYGIPFGKKDGCMQAAYIAGHPVASMYADNYRIFFIGTPHESLGLEDFDWEDPDRPEDNHQGNSGPVFGSKQFIKCANEDEFRRALEVIKKKF